MGTDYGAVEKEALRVRGSESYRQGHSFEDRVAEAYRLLGYSVEHGRIFEGRQVDMLLELDLADLHILRAVECKAGLVVADDLDKFLLKLQLVRTKYPAIQGTLVGGLSFSDGVRSHAAALGIQLTLFRDLSAQILDGPSYAQMLIREIESNERYRVQLFVEPTTGYETQGAGKLAFAVLNDWLIDGNWKQLTLLGDVGTGKSFLCRMIALRLAQEYLQSPGDAPLPLFIDLRNADREFSLEGLILTHFANHGLSRATFDIFQFLLAEGRIVLILDGFDEMASKVTPLVTTRNFHELARSVTGKAKVLLTCRTHYFKNRTEEEEVVLGSSVSQTSDVARDLYWDLIARSGFRIAYLRPFGMPQVEEYVHKACPSTAAAVLRKIHGIYNLAELSHRPLLLDMIVKSIDRLTAFEVNSAKLYEIFTDAWVHRDRWRDIISPEEKLRFLTMLARFLWEQEKTTVHYQKLQEYVQEQLKGLIDSPQKLLELDGEIRTASFLVRDDTGHYGFAHSSYAEYFLARQLASHVSKGDTSTLATRRLTNEVADFLFSMVDAPHFEQELTRILCQPYRPQVSENAFILLYRLRRNILIEERSRGRDDAILKVEMPAGVQMQGAKLAGANIEGAVLDSACLDGADLRQCIARGTDLSNASLRMASISKGDLQLACLRNASVTQAIMTEVNLHKADVSGCDFTNTDLQNSIFTVATLTGANLTGANFEGAATSAILLTPSDQLTIGEPIREREGLNSTTRESLLLEAHKLARGFAARSGLRAYADDIASDVVVFLLSNPKFLRLEEFQPRLKRFVKNLTWSRILSLEKIDRGRYRPDRHDDAWHGLEGPDDEPMPEDQCLEEAGAIELPWSESYANHELVTILGAMLSEDARELLIARYINDETTQSIAKRLGISEVGVVRQLNKARELARQALRSLDNEEY
jgi:RNA polymerase sigma factor (sigma-70 family)